MDETMPLSKRAMKQAELEMEQRREDEEAMWMWRSRSSTNHLALLKSTFRSAGVKVDWDPEDLDGLGVRRPRQLRRKTSASSASSSGGKERTIRGSTSRKRRPGLGFGSGGTGVMDVLGIELRETRSPPPPPISGQSTRRLRCRSPVRSPLSCRPINASSSRGLDVDMDHDRESTPRPCHPAPIHMLIPSLSSTPLPVPVPITDSAPRSRSLTPLRRGRSQGRRGRTPSALCHSSISGHERTASSPSSPFPRHCHQLSGVSGGNSSRRRRRQHSRSLHRNRTPVVRRRLPPSLAYELFLDDDEEEFELLRPPPPPGLDQAHSRPWPVDEVYPVPLVSSIVDNEEGSDEWVDCSDDPFQPPLPLPTSTSTPTFSSSRFDTVTVPRLPTLPAPLSRDFAYPPTMEADDATIRSPTRKVRKGLDVGVFDGA